MVCPIVPFPCLPVRSAKASECYRFVQSCSTGELISIGFLFPKVASVYVGVAWALVDRKIWLPPNATVVARASLQTHELLTLTALWDYARRHPDDYILYVHSKGARYGGPHTPYLVEPGCEQPPSRSLRARVRRFVTASGGANGTYGGLLGAIRRPCFHANATQKVLPWVHFSLSAVDDWVDYLLYFSVWLWPLAVQALDAGAGAVGQNTYIHPSCGGGHPYYRYYLPFKSRSLWIVLSFLAFVPVLMQWTFLFSSGNFLWLKAKYAQHLRPFTGKELYICAETWLGTNRTLFPEKMACTFHSQWPHYEQRYPRQQYVRSDVYRRVRQGVLSLDVSPTRADPMRCVASRSDFTQTP